jgi:hypothetical protein
VRGNDALLVRRQRVALDVTEAHVCAQYDGMQALMESDLDEFVRGQRSAARRKALIAAAVIGTVGGAAAVSAVLLKRTPCEEAVEHLCMFSGPGPECDAFRRNVGNLNTERCVRALEGFRAADELPPFVRTAALSTVVEELVGMTPELKAASDAVYGPMSELDRTGKLSPQSAEALLAAPPAACWNIIGKMKMGQPYAQEPLHEVLVRLNNGTDLGPAGDDWMVWCQERAPR